MKLGVLKNKSDLSNVQNPVDIPLYMAGVYQHIAIVQGNEIIESERKVWFHC